MGRWMKPAVFLLVLGVLQGCAFMPHKISFSPHAEIRQVDIGQGKTVLLSVVDDRVDKMIGRRGTLYGGAAEISSTQDLENLIRTEVASGLRQKGFKPVFAPEDSPRRLSVEIQLIEYTASFGFITGGIHGKVALKASATAGGKNFDYIYRAHRERRAIFVPTAGSDQRTMNEAMTMVLEELFADERLWAILASE